MSVCGVVIIEGGHDVSERAVCAGFVERSRRILGQGEGGLVVGQSK